MSLKILIVDDDEMSVFMNERLAVISGLSSEPACLLNGKAAINYLDEHYKEDDLYLVLLDINMPVMDGWQFLDVLQTKPYVDNVLVVMVTSSINGADRTKAFTYKQVIDYAEKPVELLAYKRLMQLPQIAHYFSTSDI